MNWDQPQPETLTFDHDVQPMPDAVMEFVQRAIKETQDAVYSEQRSVRRSSWGFQSWFAPWTISITLPAPASRCMLVISQPAVLAWSLLGRSGIALSPFN